MLIGVKCTFLLYNLTVVCTNYIWFYLYICAKYAHLIGNMFHLLYKKLLRHIEYN